MTIINRRRDLIDGGWPVTDGLWALYLAGSENNTLTGAPSDKITVLYDESGNGRHATSATGETWEPTGLSTSKPCIRNTGDRLLIDAGGENLTTDKFSVFCAGQSTDFQIAFDQTGGDRMVALTFTINDNSPLVRNNAAGQVVRGLNGGIEYFTDFADEVARTWVFLYDDTANIATFYVSKVLTNEVGDPFYTTAPAGSFTPLFVGRDTDSTNNRIGALAIYEDKILSGSEITVLHDFVKDTLGIVA